MKAELYYDLIRRPVISEKATVLAEQGKYVFEIDCNATKAQVKSAIEKDFLVLRLSQLILLKFKEKQALSWNYGKAK